MLLVLEWFDKEKVIVPRVNTRGELVLELI